MPSSPAANLFPSIWVVGKTDGIPLPAFFVPSLWQQQPTENHLDIQSTIVIA
jgi:hypothetical protein